MVDGHCSALVGLTLIALVIFASGRQLMSQEISESRADAILVAASVLVIGLLIVTGKVFSPQYLLWLIAPLAVVYALRADQDRWLFGIVATACATTTFVYPVMYSQLIAGEGLPWAVLQMRNLLLVIAVGNSRPKVARVPSRANLNRPHGPRRTRK